MKQRKDVLRPVDETARRLARSLVRAARYGSLATLTADDGAPLASRVLVASDEAGHPLLLVSHLSAHAGALATEPRCSLLFGEVGEGDPLAHPRISLFGRAETLIDDDRAEARARFLARHPSAAAYCDFTDFRFVRVATTGASLNGGFARAYAMSATDIVDAPRPDLADRLRRAADHMNADHSDAVDTIAARHADASGEGWRIVTVDPTGFEVARDDELRRVFFDAAIRSAEDIRAAFVALAREGAAS